MEQALTVNAGTLPANPVSTFLAGRSTRTMAAYGKDLASFAAFGGHSSVDAAARAFLASQPAANAMAHAYRAHMVAGGLSPATVNRRLSALRSLSKFARLLGWAAWEVEVPNLPAVAYRDTTGCGTGGFQRMLAAAQAVPGAKGLRDRAILRLLYDQALRREELAGLLVEDLSLSEGRLAVRGKGRHRQAEFRTLAPPTKAALAAWLEARGAAPGPLFTGLHPGNTGGRLSGTSVARIVHALGAAAGVGHAHPHGLRHAAITAALDLTGGDVRKVQQFSRHRDMRVLMRYDDARRDFAGEVGALVAAG